MLLTKHNSHTYMHMFLQPIIELSTYAYSQLAREQNVGVKYVPSPTE